MLCRYFYTPNVDVSLTHANCFTYQQIKAKYYSALVEKKDYERGKAGIIIPVVSDIHSRLNTMTMRMF